MDSSDHFFADKWQKHGIKYFWNSAIEKQIDCGGLKQKFFNCELVKFTRCYLDRIFGDNDLLRTTSGEQIPAPVYWRHPTRTKDFISFGTIRPEGHFPGWVWNYKYNESTLEELVQNRGVIISHAYPAFVGRKLGYSNGAWYKENGVYKIDEDFDEMLARMGRFQSEGLINFTTIRDFLDYRLKLQNVEIISLNNIACKVVNHNDKIIKGFSLSVNSDSVIVFGKEFESKRVGKELVFWFDLRANEEVVVKVGY